MILSSILSLSRCLSSAWLHLLNSTFLLFNALYSIFPFKLAFHKIITLSLFWIRGARLKWFGMIAAMYGIDFSHNPLYGGLLSSRFSSLNFHASEQSHVRFLCFVSFVFNGNGCVLADVCIVCTRIKLTNNMQPHYRATV